MKTLKKIPLFLLIGSLVMSLSACGESRERVLIYVSSVDYEIDYLNQRLTEEFPQYDITLEYLSTGNHAAKLLAEGTNTDADITYALEYGYLTKLEQQGYLADLSDFPKPNYTKDADVSNYFVAQERSGGSIIVDPASLKEKNLPEPSCYQDLLKPEYKNLISVPNPKASGTGYMFLKSLVNAWGEEQAFAYFDALTPNIYQYSSSGVGPVNAILQGEAAIGLGMTAQAVTAINDGANLKILHFEEGSPYSLYGMGIIHGKENREAVRDVFNFLMNTYTYENCERFFPEKLFTDRDYTVKNYPQNIHYADMCNDTIEEKERLLDRWKY